MTKIYKYLEEYIKRTVKSIAFFPVIISSGFLLLSFLVFYLETTPVVGELKQEIPNLFIRNLETARTTLSIIIGGVLSLTVFSFSMVMVVLGQASANFSPRLLPGLVSDKKHQIILGIYIGTLLFSISTLLFIGANTNTEYDLGLAVTISAVLCFICVGLFAYFIHTISQSIQITSITDIIYHNIMNGFNKKLAADKDTFITSVNKNTDKWHIITARKSSYFRGFSTRYLTKNIKNKETSIEVLPYIGQFLWEGDVILRTESTFTFEEKESLHSGMLYSNDRLEGDNALSGLIKLGEVAVKALSPGINDPGTAIDCIIKIGKVLDVLLATPLQQISKTENANLIVIKNQIKTNELLRLVIQPIRQYAKDDILVTCTLINSLLHLSKNPKIKEEEKNSIHEELHVLKETASKEITINLDRERILSLFKDFK